MDKDVDTISQYVDKEDITANLEQALAVAGFGRYNMKYSLALALLLLAAVVELISYSFILPAAACDLNMTDSQRGFVASIPFIGIIITSYPWGYVVDTRGRKKALVYSSLAAGFFSMVSGLMPNLSSFATCKFLTSLCLAGPSAIPYTYIGEILPSKYRDVTLSIINAIQATGTVIVPLLAWAILPLDFAIVINDYTFRPWRLLIIVYGALLVIITIVISLGPESPKYLVSQGRFDEALKVLQDMYAGNKRRKPEDYPIKKLIAPANEREKGGFLTSLKVQTVPLLKWEYLKWLLLNGFLLIGAFAVVNGLYAWVPDILNKVLTGDGAGKTACQVIADRLNQTSSSEAVCNDTMDEITFLINSVAQATCAAVAIVASATIRIIGKKNLLLSCYFIIGTFCILINFITNDMVFAVLLSSFPILVLTLGPINAYAVEIFPTHVRGMAISMSMMLGRIGSILGTNIGGLLINNACEATFYLFGGLLIFCGVLAFLLPKSRGSLRKSSNINDT